MSPDIDRFLKDYVAALHDGDAALFVGAGLSRPSGFVDWKELLRDCAKELGLDVKREQDLVAVAQYHLNSRNRDRSRLNQILTNEFGKPGLITDNHKTIARLPIKTVWTTNFDTLLERAYDDDDVTVDVKPTDKSIARTKRGRDVVLYKMHGDIATPEEVIICKDDYERYAREHTIFQQVLESDLVSKTFLFLGFSFTDPNLNYMLGHLRSLLQDSKREHFAVMRRVNSADFTGKNKRKEFLYEQNRQGHQVKDLLRYSIQTLLIDKYSEITEILKKIERCNNYRNVFVSGSASDFGSFGQERMQDLSRELGFRLIKESYNLVSGFGLGIGSAVIMGALEKLYTAKRPSVEKRLTLRPFPQKQLTGKAKKDFNRKYREDMLERCGFALFIAGNKQNKIAPGVLEEFEIAKSMGRTVIPLGATGFAAEKIWQELSSEIKQHYSGSVSKKVFARLNDRSLSNTEILSAAVEIMKSVEQVQG